MGKVIVIGSSNTDMVVTSGRMPVPGETVMGNSFSIFAGGKGANQAVAAARAGGEVTFITKTGDDDFGKKAIEGYKKDNINTGLIFTDPKQSSGIAVIIVDEKSGQNSIVVAAGANSSLSPDDIRQIEPQIAAADTLLVQLEIPLATVQLSLEIAKKNGIRTILNPAPAQLLSDEFLSLVDIITPNETETNTLIGIHPIEEAEVREAASLLLGKVNEAVLITLGEKGAYYLDKNGTDLFVPTTKVSPQDTTAAGDVFNGYLAAALAGGTPITDAIQLANKAAAISVTRPGAQPSIPHLEELLNP